LISIVEQVRAGALAVSARPVVSFEEESSGCPSGQYVTAVSLSSLEVEEPPLPQQQPFTSSFFQPSPTDGGDDDSQFTETAI